MIDYDYFKSSVDKFYFLYDVNTGELGSNAVYTIFRECGCSSETDLAKVCALLKSWVTGVIYINGKPRKITPNGADWCKACDKIAFEKEKLMGKVYIDPRSVNMVFDNLKLNKLNKKS